MHVVDMAEESFWGYSSGLLVTGLSESQRSAKALHLIMRMFEIAYCEGWSPWMHSKRQKVLRMTNKDLSLDSGSGWTLEGSHGSATSLDETRTQNMLTLTCWR